MKIGTTVTAGVPGPESVPVRVEADLLPGPFGMQIVGLGDNAVKESRERIRSAIVNSGYEFPMRQIIINLAPNDIPKHGSLSELAIAVAILKASGQVQPGLLDNWLFAGSLSLDGSIRGAEGILPAALLARKNSTIAGIVAASEATRKLLEIPELQILKIDHLHQLGGFRFNRHSVLTGRKFKPVKTENSIDMAQIRGHKREKKGLAVSAVGGHHTLLIGVPGSGKTMLGRAYAGILPDLTLDESLEISSIYAAAGRPHLVTHRPFRSPHHTSSDIALVGGGSRPVPGEVSLAHRGVLFLDELLEFRNSTLQALREPLEEKAISISRAKGSYIYPAAFTLLAATNPCRCGFILAREKICSCRPSKAGDLLRKIAGPFSDRLALEIEMPEEPPSFGRDTTSAPSYDSTYYKNKVIAARERMFHRNRGRTNSELSEAELVALLQKVKNWQQLIEYYRSLLSLSHRGLVNSLRVALSLADYENREGLCEEMLEEAFSYRIMGHLQQLVLRSAA